MGIFKEIYQFFKLTSFEHIVFVLESTKVLINLGDTPLWHPSRNEITALCMNQDVFLTVWTQKSTFETIVTKKTKTKNM